nr:hypothetical protein [Tanacetum cinerariifolium]
SPDSYKLNATVDAKIAKHRSPLPITSVTAPFYSSVTEPLANLTKYIPLPSIPIPGFMSSEKGKDGTKSDKPTRKPNMVRLPSGIE